MKKQIVAVVSALVLSSALAFTTCGKETETTFTGIVMRIDGSTLYLQEYDSESAANTTFTMPSVENTDGSESFNPGNFNPGDINIEDFNSEDFEGKIPNMSDFTEQFSNFDTSAITQNIDESELVSYDITDAHISVEIDDGKAAGTLDDISIGSIITVTYNSKGKVSNVLVSSSSAFGGFENFGKGFNPSMMPGNFSKQDQ